MRRKTLLALVAIAAIAAVPSAQAHSPKGSQPAPWTVVASGLDNPRGSRSRRTATLGREAGRVARALHPGP